jgi:hypothetical protein
MTIRTIEGHNMADKMASTRKRMQHAKRASGEIISEKCWLRVRSLEREKR